MLLFLLVNLVLFVSVNGGAHLIILRKFHAHFATATTRILVVLLPDFILLLLRCQETKRILGAIGDHHRLESGLRSIESHDVAIGPGELPASLWVCGRRDGAESLLADKHTVSRSGNFVQVFGVDSFLIDREEGVDLGVSSHSLPLQLERLVDFTLSDQRAHIDLNRSSELLATNRCVNQLNITVFPLVASLAVLVERALPLEGKVELIGVPIPIHLKRLTDVLLGASCPPNFEHEGLLDIHLKRRNFQLDRAEGLFSTHSLKQLHIALSPFMIVLMYYSIIISWWKMKLKNYN